MLMDILLLAMFSIAAIYEVVPTAPKILEISALYVLTEHEQRDI